MLILSNKDPVLNHWEKIHFEQLLLKHKRFWIFYQLIINLTVKYAFCLIGDDRNTLNAVQRKINCLWNNRFENTNINEQTVYSILIKNTKNDKENSLF